MPELCIHYALSAILNLLREPNAQIFVWGFAIILMIALHVPFRSK